MLNKEFGAKILFSIYEQIQAGCTPPNDFLEALQVFIPKGVSPDDKSMVSRSAENLRPISLANTDGKIITAVISVPMNKVAQRTVDGRQRGFIRDRKMLDNILELEAYGLGAQLRGLRYAVLIFLDFAAAFPSIFHQWILFVLGAMGFPDWVMSYFQWLYAGSRAQVVYKGKRWGWIHFFRGVRQGCPSAAVTFVLALDPMLRWLSDKALRAGDDIRGYADDLGLFIQNLQDNAPLVAHAFEHIASMSGLTLKIPKCVILVMSEIELHVMQQWLARCLPAWKRMAVAKKGKYLGFTIGPCAESASWLAPVASFCSTAADIRQMGWPLQER